MQALFFRDWTKLKPVFTLIIGNIRNFCVGACPWTSIGIGTRSEPEVMKFKSKLKTLSILSKNLSFALDYIIQPNQFDAFDIKHTRHKCSLWRWSAQRKTTKTWCIWEGRCETERKVDLWDTRLFDASTFVYHRFFPKDWVFLLFLKSVNLDLWIAGKCLSDTFWLKYYDLVIKYTKSHHPNCCITVDNTPPRLSCWWVILIFLSPDMAGSVGHV